MTPCTYLRRDGLDLGQYLPEQDLVGVGGQGSTQEHVFVIGARDGEHGGGPEASHLSPQLGVLLWVV